MSQANQVPKHLSGCLTLKLRHRHAEMNWEMAAVLSQRHWVQMMSSPYSGSQPDPGFPWLGLVNMTTYKEHSCQESASWLSKFPLCISVLLNKCLQVPFLVSGRQHIFVFILMGTCGHSISFWIVDIWLQV